MKLIWITGLSGSGKTTIGKEVYKKLKIKYTNTVFLDGDSFREVLGNDLSHNLEDRKENARRIARMCNFLVSQGISVICATMSLYAEIHKYNRENFKHYFEIFIKCDMEELIKRDQKGLYSKAISGEIKYVVGVDLPYDIPKDCDLIIENSKQDSLDEKVEKIIKLLEKK